MDHIFARNNFVKAIQQVNGFQGHDDIRAISIGGYREWHLPFELSGNRADDRNLLQQVQMFPEILLMLCQYAIFVLDPAQPLSLKLLQKGIRRNRVVLIKPLRGKHQPTALQRLLKSILMRQHGVDKGPVAVEDQT